MNTYIALLRGINVGGHKKTPMAEKSGLINVKTYIQSGNVVFQSKEKKASKLKDLIKNAIVKHFGFEVPIFVKRPSEIQSIIDACPFSKEEKLLSYFTLLQDTPSTDLVDHVRDIKYPNEVFVITSDCIYFYSAAGYGNAKYNNSFFEKKLKVSMTARNYRTMIKLIEMASNL